MITPTLSDEVAAAVADGRAVVALESTIFSNLGLPTPANREALDRCVAAIRDGGADRRHAPVERLAVGGRGQPEV